MRLPLRRALLIFGAAGLLAAPVAAAKVPAGSTTVTKGPLSATLSWDASDFSTAEGAHLQVSRDGTVVLDEDLAKECDVCTSLADPEHAIAIRDLEADGAPEVVVDTFSGGAHCCYTSIVVWFAGADVHTTVESWGNGSYVLRQLDGAGGPEFVSIDDRFAYTFTSYVGSWRPPLILKFTNGMFEDHTRTYGKRVLADIRAIDKELPKVRDFDARGLVAARAADMALIGFSAERIHRYLEGARRKGYANGPSGYPKGAKFVARVERLLHTWNYLRILVP